MADEQPPAGQTPPPPVSSDPASLPAPSKPTPQPDDVASLPTWAQALVTDLRKENASHRTAKTAAERQAQAATEQAAKDQGKWRELAEQYEPKAKQADDLLQFATELLEDELKDIPARFKLLIPKYDNPRQTIMWLRDARRTGLFALPSAPVTDASADGNAETSAAGQAAKEQEVWQRLGFTNALRTQTRTR